MTKDEFLSNAVEIFWTGNQTIPEDWIKEAWKIEAFRDNATYEMIRSVRKDGDFFHAQYWLQLLPEILTEQQVIDLYVAIRDESHRWEDEWRGEFEEAFRQSADKLPPPRLEEDVDDTAL